MRKQYAAAIREGIEKGRKTRFGIPGDPYYTLRSELIWAQVFPGDSRKCREIALEAFNRTALRKRESEIRQMTDEEYQEAKANHERAWVYHTETRQEREYRLLREEVEKIRKELATSKGAQ